jgi:hypothetical protein
MTPCVVGMCYFYSGVQFLIIYKYMYNYEYIINIYFLHSSYRSTDCTYCRHDLFDRVGCRCGGSCKPLWRIDRSLNNPEMSEFIKSARNQSL